MFGAAGGVGDDGQLDRPSAPAGLGGHTTATIAVTPGETIQINVGCVGSDSLGSSAPGGFGGSPTLVAGGGGGTQIANGLGGSAAQCTSTGVDGADGTNGAGGDGGSEPTFGAGGGGGGGYHSGGGGAGGGGDAGFAAATATGVVQQVGVQEGNGRVVVTFTPVTPTPAPALTVQPSFTG